MLKNHTCTQTHKHRLAWGPNAAATTHRNRKICPHTPMCTAGMRSPQGALSHTQQRHTSSVMSVCTSHPQTADPFIREAAAQGHPQHAPAASPAPPPPPRAPCQPTRSVSIRTPYVISCTFEHKWLFIQQGTTQDINILLV